MHASVKELAGGWTSECDKQIRIDLLASDQRTTGRDHLSAAPTGALTLDALLWCHAPLRVRAHGRSLAPCTNSSRSVARASPSDRHAKGERERHVGGDVSLTY